MWFSYWTVHKCVPSRRVCFDIGGGLATDVKVHPWKIINLPSLLNNMKIFTIDPGQQKHVECYRQPRIVGFSKRSHHSGSSKQSMLMTSCHRSFGTHIHNVGDFLKVDSPVRALEIQLMKELLHDKCPWNPITSGCLGGLLTDIYQTIIH